MSHINFIFGLHNHQPIGNFDSVFVENGLGGAEPIDGSTYRLTIMIEDHQLGDPGDVDFFKFTAPAALPSPPVTFFSVDADTDQLVTIDPVTGVVTNIGPIGHDMNDTDLTFLNGKLYAVTPNSPNASTATQWDLVELNPFTGLADSIVAKDQRPLSGPAPINSEIQFL